MGDVVELSDHKLTDELRELSAGVSKLVWQALSTIPVEDETIDVINYLLELEMGLERLASERRFRLIRGC
jgi:hypothetical protein